MYGLYKYKKHYSVEFRNARRKRHLIVMYSNLEVLNTIATNLNLNVPVVQLNAGPDLQNKFTANNMPLECNLHVQVAQNSSTELQNESTSNNMLPECYLHVPIVHNSSIEIQNNSTSNDVISEGNLHVQVTQNSSTELQNESTSNVLPECHLHVPIVHNSSMEIQNNSTSNDVISECNLHIQVIQNSSMEIQNDPTSNEVLSKGNVHVPVVQNASKELPNDSILNDMLSECNIHVPVIQNASTELQNDSTSNDMLSECNIYVPVLQNASLDLENEFTSNDMLSECSLNVSTIRNVSTELENESASNNMLSECNLYVPVIQNVNTELQNESVSNDILSECNLHQDILNPSETSIDNFTLNTNFDQTVTILFDELNDLGISPNNMLNYSNEDENNVSKNLNQSCNVDNSMEIENNRNEANHEKAMNDIDVAKLIKESNNNLKQVNDISNLNNSDCSDCYSDKDPDYHYSTDSENSEVEDDAQHCSIQSTNTTNSSLETSLNASRQQICDDANLHVECSKPKGQEKKNFCFYCKKMQAKISRHLERVHKNEEEVKKFTGLPKGNKERQKIIGLLRRRGNYLYNTDPTYNKGELIVCRRPTESRKKAAHDFICCAGCKGFFTKNNIRHHFKQCTKKIVGRTVKVLGRKVQGRIHESANSILRNVVFPILREDDIIRLIRYDELLITYGNKLCIKYKHQHQQDMIRARLRLLGRFLKAIKKINKNVTDFFSIYHPSIYDDCITAVNQVAGYNTSTKVYAAPSVASRIGTLIKQIGNLAIAECIKQNKFQKKVDIENFLKLLQEDFGVSVNKTVEESILQAKRYQLQELPPLEDIKLLHNFLQTNRRLAFQRLSDTFTYDNWRQLAQFTLISVQVFNRRRAGEIERIFIDDYKHQEGINEQTNPDLYESLSPEAQKTAMKYVRFVIRGKLGRPVPVLLDSEMKSCIDLLLHYRKEAKIPDANLYIFALPGYDKKRFRYIRACDLLRTYFVACGASMPLRLRGTKLRKHIATRCITLNLSDPEVTELANYLGHNKNIHMQHYRQSLPQFEIVKMSRLLKMAQGEDDDFQQNDKENNSQINIDNLITNEFETNGSGNSDIDIDVDNDYVDTNSTCGANRKRRSTSPYGATKRVRWTQTECNTIITAFKQEMSERRLPSGKQMVEVKMKNNCLSRRSIPQIRSWIHNQISRKSKPRAKDLDSERE